MQDAATPDTFIVPTDAGAAKQQVTAIPPVLLGVEDPLPFLAGRWTTHRRLLDRTTGMTGTFTGLTTFTPDDGGLRWDEQGTVSWPSFEGPAFRSYRVLGVGGAVIDIRFMDARLLCRLDLGTGAARDEHDCSPDTYLVDFAVRSRKLIHYTWDVTGPAKDLLLTTTLERRSEAATAPETSGGVGLGPVGGA
ncbi:DUF6314 family protein [Arthrobacter cheniae]|nr:DUF6314 family protein [Arthrobacter cheniae]